MVPAQNFPASSRRVTVTALGQCGFLLASENARIVTDPYLSDYVDRHFRTPAVPWERLYPAPTTLARLDPDAVLISHAHEDHLDPDTLGPYIASRGRALIAAPAPEVGRLTDLGAPRVLPARAETPFLVGSVQITPILCAHTEPHADEQGRFRELSYCIDFGNENRVFFGGDMSLYDSLMARLRAFRPTLLLLPANGRDADRTSRGIIGNVTVEEAAEIARTLNVPWTPMHHDLYQVNRCPIGEPERCSRAAGCVCHPLKVMESLTLENGAVMGV